MNLLNQYTPAELAKKTIEDMKRRKEYSMLIRQKVKRKLIEKNKKFYK